MGGPLKPALPGARAARRKSDLPGGGEGKDVLVIEGLVVAGDKVEDVAGELGAARGAEGGRVQRDEERRRGGQPVGAGRDGAAEGERRGQGGAEEGGPERAEVNAERGQREAARKTKDGGGPLEAQTPSQDHPLPILCPKPKPGKCPRTLTSCSRASGRRYDRIRRRRCSSCGTTGTRASSSCWW